MVERVKIVPKIITIHEGRPSFMNATTPTYRTNKFGQPDKGTPEKPKKRQFRMTWLLDPSNAQAAATIKEIKDEAARQLDIYWNGREHWPQDNKQTGTKGIIPCFGNGNDLKKVYDGYKDMFFVKVAENEDTRQPFGGAPIIGDRRGRQIVLLEDNAWHILDKATGKPTEETVSGDEVPYSGAVCRGRISLYIYNNESHGINANFRSVQFVRPGQAFGGRRSGTAAEELAEMAGDAPQSASTQSTGDPW